MEKEFVLTVEMNVSIHTMMSERMKRFVRYSSMSGYSLYMNSDHIHLLLRLPLWLEHSRTIKGVFLSELQTSRTAALCIEHKSLSVPRPVKSQRRGQRCEAPLLENVLAEGQVVHANAPTCTFTLGRTCLIVESHVYTQGLKKFKLGFRLYKFHLTDGMGLDQSWNN